MPTSLLDRQVSLLEYLTSSGAIFGDNEIACLNPALLGIDLGLLRLEACFSHEKRMEKITAIFPRTFQILGTNRAATVREFVVAYPPTDISRLENARQFFNFICNPSRREPLEPPYVCDVAACELAIAKVRVGAEDRLLDQARDEHAPRDGIRRHPGVILLRCAHNIRPIFEGGSGEAPPIGHDTLLAIAIPPYAEHPRVFELLPPAFDVLAALNDWTDRFALSAAPEFSELICDLAEHGLVEERKSARRLGVRV
jgi:hypothetical protein